MEDTAANKHLLKEKNIAHEWCQALAYIPIRALKI